MLDENHYVVLTWEEMCKALNSPGLSLDLNALFVRPWSVLSRRARGENTTALGLLVYVGIKLAAYFIYF